MKILAVIPARSGSKGLKDKNIKPLNGVPLCAYSIRAAVDSGVFEEVHFSTDSRAYADIAMQYGASVPFLREEILATDTASSWDVMKAVLKQYEAQGKIFDAIMLLQPTVPLRSAEDIRNAVAILKERNAQAVVSVTEPEHSPVLCAELPENGDMRIFHDRFQHLVARQMLKQQYRINGAIYLTRVEHFLNASSIYEHDCLAYKMPSERSFDIDTQLDFDWCEFMLKRNM